MFSFSEKFQKIIKIKVKILCKYVDKVYQEQKRNLTACLQCDSALIKSMASDNKYLQNHYTVQNTPSFDKATDHKCQGQYLL